MKQTSFLYESTFVKNVAGNFPEIESRLFFALSWISAAHQAKKSFGIMLISDDGKQHVSTRNIS